MICDVVAGPGTRLFVAFLRPSAAIWFVAAEVKATMGDASRIHFGRSHATPSTRELGFVPIPMTSAEGAVALLVPAGEEETGCLRATLRKHGRTIRNYLQQKKLSRTS